MDQILSAVSIRNWQLSEINNRTEVMLKDTFRGTSARHHCGWYPSVAGVDVVLAQIGRRKCIFENGKVHIGFYHVTTVLTRTKGVHSEVAGVLISKA